MTQKMLTILEGTPGIPGIHLRTLRHPITGEYTVPIRQDQAFYEKWHLDILMHLYIESHPSANQEEAFLAAQADLNSMRNKKSDTSIAIMDTGLLYEHPLLKDCIEESVDFTGEGVEDYNGHGTIVALLARTSIPLIPSMINVKVCDASGMGIPEDLVRGLEWLIDYKKRRNIQNLIANLSLGVYSTDWLGRECKGDCEVCRAAIKAAESGIRLSIAAGNKPGMTTCPARVKLTKKVSGIMVTSAQYYEKSGIGDINLPVSTNTLIPLSTGIAQGYIEESTSRFVQEINLLAEPKPEAQVIGRIQHGETVALLQHNKDYALVIKQDNSRGFVPMWIIKQFKPQ